MHSTEIRYFLAVANSGSLSAASQQLFIAVSAISRQIQRLEERVGAPLFERHARGMVLNNAGQILENHVRKSVTDMQLAIAEIRGLKAIQRTAIRVACTEGLAFELLPTLFGLFRQQYPSVSFHLMAGSALETSQRVRSGEADVALQFSLAPERGVNIIASLAAPVLLVMAADHPLVDKKICLTDLQHYPLALPDQATTIRQLLDLSCRMSGTFLEPVLCCNNLAALYYFILNTPGAITACSHFSLFYKAKEQQIRLKETDVEQLNQRSLQIQTMVGQRHSAALQCFLDFLQTELKSG